MERDTKYDNLKLFLIYCVILGHLGNRFASKSDAVAALQLWIYLFHMPAFIYISGFFSKYSIDGVRWDRAASYLILYIFMELLPVVDGVIRGGIESVSVDILNENGVPWFALAMFEWYAAAILFRRVHPAYVLSLSVFLAIAAGYLPQIGSFLTFQRAIIFFPIFYLGYITDSEKLSEWTKKPGIRIAAVIFLLTSLVICFWKVDLLSPWRLLFRAKSDYSAIETSISIRWGWLWRIIFYIVSMVLTFALIAVTPSRKFNITPIGTKTLPVYAFHYTLIRYILMIPEVKKFMAGSYLMPKCLVFGAAILFLTSLPVFDIPLRYLIRVPLNNKNAQ